MTTTGKKSRSKVDAIRRRPQGALLAARLAVHKTGQTREAKTINMFFFFFWRGFPSRAFTHCFRQNDRKHMRARTHYRRHRGQGPAAASSNNVIRKCKQKPLSKHGNRPKFSPFEHAQRTRAAPESTARPHTCALSYRAHARSPSNVICAPPRKNGTHFPSNHSILVVSVQSSPIRPRQKHRRTQDPSASLDLALRRARGAHNAQERGWTTGWAFAHTV